MKRIVATLLAAMMMIAPALTQDLAFGGAPPGGPGGPFLTGITQNGITNQGVTGAGMTPGYLNTPSAPFNVNDVGIGDFNGDGLADIAVAQSGFDDSGGGGTLVLLTGQGDGTFGFPISIPIMNMPVAISVSKAGQDGVSDIAVTGLDFNSDVSGQLTVFSGSTLSQGLPNATPTQWLDGVPTSVTFGRLNGDATQDIGVGLSFGDGSGAVQALYTDPPSAGGGFSFSGSDTIPLTVAPSCISSISMTNSISSDSLSLPDGVPVDFSGDITIATSSGIEIFENQAGSVPAGGLTTWARVMAQSNDGPADWSNLLAGSPTTGIVVGDVNGDNINDILSLNRGSGTLTTFLGDPSASGGFGFSAPQTSLVGANPVGLTLMNFNNDGVVDIAVANAGDGGSAGNVTILQGSGTGLFSMPQVFPVSAWPNALTAGFNPILPSSLGTPFNVLNFCNQNAAACGGNGLSLPSKQTAVSAGTNPRTQSAQTPGRDEASRRLDAVRHLGRSLAGLLSTGAPQSLAFARFPSFAAPQASQQTEPAQVVITATGVSSGDFFQMEIIDKSGRAHRGVLPEGVVLEPVASPPVTPPAGASTTTQGVSGFCMDFAKEVPAPGTRYRIASPAAQAQARPLGSVLAAAKQLAMRNLLHTDGSTGYINFIRQYAVWAKKENWDLKKFGESFVERTKKNVVAMGQNWTGVMEDGVRAAIPGRWADVEQVLRLSNQIAAPPSARK